MQWPSKCVRPSNLIMAISWYSDFSNSLLRAATGTGYWLKLLGCLAQGCGWERLIGLLPRVQMQPQSPPPPVSPHATYKHTNTKHRLTSAYLQIPLRSSSAGLISSAQMRAINGKESCGENVTGLWNEDLGPLQQPTHSSTVICSSMYSHQGPVAASEE